MNIYTFIDPLTGKAITQKYPLTKAEAIRDGLNFYWPGTFCDRHPTERSVYYVGTEKPTCCIHDDAVKAYNEAISVGEPSTPQQARVMGCDYYWEPIAFMKCGHVGMNTLRGKCYTCEHERVNKPESPRLKAISAGEIWYTPNNGKRCARGHVGTRRRVSNGYCEQCEVEDKAKRGEVRPAPFYRQFPDMILSYADAKAMGLNVYRTGSACKAGHTGWRYVTTRSCLKCMGRE